MSSLIVAAHPDDEVLGCGGTVARKVKEGEEVCIAILGEGETSRWNSHSTDEASLDRLAAASRSAARILGVSQLLTFNLPDNRFDQIPLLKVVKLLEEVIERIQPTQIYCQLGGDLNIDHQITFRAALTAARPMPGGSVSSFYAYEVMSSTEWAFGRFSPRFSPNHFVDISASLETKLEAARAYASELREFPHPRSVETIRAAAVRWGSTVGTAAAEAFELIWSKV